MRHMVKHHRGARENDWSTQVNRKVALDGAALSVYSAEAIALPRDECDSRKGVVGQSVGTTRMLFGIIWALIAPVILLLPFWAVVRILDTLGLPDKVLANWNHSHQFLMRGALAAVLVLGPVAVVWQLDHRAFVQVCQQQGMPLIARTAKADGFFLDDGTANSFGMRYVQEEGFQWIEARSIYKRDSFVRYTRSSDGTISEVPQPAISARYSVVGSHEQPYTHTSVTSTRVIDTQASEGAKEMARAAMVHFNGGRLHWVLGIYGADSFPSVTSDSQAWNDAYHLVRNTLSRVPTTQAAN